MKLWKQKEAKRGERRKKTFTHNLTHKNIMLHTNSQPAQRSISASPSIYFSAWERSQLWWYFVVAAFENFSTKRRIDTIVVTIVVVGLMWTLFWSWTSTRCCCCWLCEKAWKSVLMVTLKRFAEEDDARVVVDSMVIAYKRKCERNYNVRARYTNNTKT